MSEQYRIFTSRLILLSLLASRFFGQFIFDVVINEQAEPIARSLNLTVTFLLILIAVWINKSRLYELNLDRAAYVLLLAATLLLGWHFTPYFIGAFLLVAVGAIIIIGRKESFQFSQPIILSGRLIMPLILALLSLISPMLLMPNFSFSLQDFTLIPLALKNASFWGVYFEEFLFRGMLWDYLRSLSLRSIHIIIIQASLFWLAHISSAGNWIFFWIALPFMSIMLGLLVHQSKSLTACVATHFLYNCIVGLIDASG